MAPKRPALSPSIQKKLKRLAEFERAERARKKKEKVRYAKTRAKKKKTWVPLEKSFAKGVGPSKRFIKEWQKKGGTFRWRNGAWQAELLVPPKADARDELFASSVALTPLLRKQKKAWMSVGALLEASSLKNSPVWTPNHYYTRKGARVFAVNPLRIGRWSRTKGDPNTDGTQLAFVAGDGAVQIAEEEAAEVQGTLIQVAWGKKKPKWRRG